MRRRLRCDERTRPSGAPVRETSTTVALSLGTTDRARAGILGWKLNAESLRVRDDPAIQTATQIRDNLRAFVDRERSARITRLQCDLNPQRAPLIGNWSTLLEKREREYRVFGRLQVLAAKEGFEAWYDSELDARLRPEGFSLSERGAIRRRIENGYLRDLGRPDDTGRLTQPRGYLQTMLTSMNEPMTEASLNHCRRGFAALSGHVSREFASTYAEARADPREACTNLSAMRAKDEVPRNTLGWAKSDFDGGDSFEWGDFEVNVPAPSQQAMDDDERSDARPTEPASSWTPEKDSVPGRGRQTSAAPTPPHQTCFTQGSHPRVWKAVPFC